MFLNISTPQQQQLNMELGITSSSQRRAEYLSTNLLHHEPVASLHGIDTTNHRVDVHRSTSTHPYDNPTGPGYQHAILVSDEEGDLLVSSQF